MLFSRAMEKEHGQLSPEGWRKLAGRQDRHHNRNLSSLDSRPSTLFLDFCGFLRRFFCKTRQPDAAGPRRKSAKSRKNRTTQMHKVEVNRTHSDLLGPKTHEGATPPAAINICQKAGSR